MKTLAIALMLVPLVGFAASIKTYKGPINTPTPAVITEITGFSVRVQMQATLLEVLKGTIHESTWSAAHAEGKRGCALNGDKKEEHLSDRCIATDRQNKCYRWEILYSCR